MTRTEIDPAEGETLAQAAYRALRHDIITGQRRPGERLRIAMLTTLYGVGPTPLREALQKLGQDGLVMVEDNRGFAVAGLDPIEFDDLNTARTAIETEAIRLSIVRGDDAWEARVVAASYIMQKEDAALAAAAGPVTDRWENANAAFHDAIVSACGSRWLLRVRAQLHDLCERYRRASVYQKIGTRDLGAEHAAIAKAVLARDADRACDLITHHFARTAAALSDLSAEAQVPTPPRAAARRSAAP
ncbi:GntR family transcriptional regulator [Roseicyclus mahoneyensis]|uniref:GntR family transcriptional regulator n=1 Tax=Roseicyclus mahoneyensis TaxID=164332 RepID=A0A316GMX4_9RHOB|nr:FCD domain-containing protein [Roseicyclus mahoneyensis]PWK62264.1 GntR family transcriptional regulator [Roseicyclus mahoneyensis]